MDLTCPDCGERLSPVALETRTRFENGEFETRYRCPNCHSEFGDVQQLR